nr:hypothetical protein [Granulosicoccus sp.]
DFSNQLPIMVTAKDAVKLRSMKGLPESVFSLIHEVSTRIILSHELDVRLQQLAQSLHEKCDS